MLTSTQIIFCIIAGIFFSIPFLFWMGLRFYYKVTGNIILWHKKAKIIVFVVCLILFITFILLAIFIH